MSPSAGKQLPLEIIEAILRLLPPKPLGRFKSVSKTWNSLISDPLFIRTHLLHNHPTRTLIALSATGSLYSIDIAETRDSNDDYDTLATAKELSIGSPPIQWKEISGSCNGLLVAKDESDTIFVMNPMTQDLWKVPLCPFAPPYEEHEEVYVRYGFGYDSSTDDYKILSISFWHPHSKKHHICKTFVCVYSLRNNSWRKLPDCNYYEHDHTVTGVISGAVINQTLHWPGRYSEIVGFNLANEEFIEMNFPDPDRIVSYTTLFPGMVDVGGKLGVFMGSEDTFECCVMEEYGVADSWTKLPIHGLEKDRVQPVCMLQGSNREIVFQEKEGRLVVYNIDERRHRYVRIVGGPGGNFDVFGGTFAESLESLKRIIKST